jgi:hypothetical protein
MYDTYGCQKQEAWLVRGNATALALNMVGAIGDWLCFAQHLTALSGAPEAIHIRLTTCILGKDM